MARLVVMSEAEPSALTRETIAASAPEYVRRGRPWQPDILLIEHEGRRVIVKDYAPRKWMYRVGVGLYSVWREASIYRALTGIPGVPEFIGRIDRYALATEYIPGQAAGEARPGVVGETFFQLLSDTVDAIHGRGVVLCDMRNMNNVLISDSGRPYVIDFAASFRRGKWWNAPVNALYRLFEQDDCMGVIKLKRRLAPDLLTHEEAERYRKGVFLQTPAIAMRNWSRKWLKRLAGPRTS